MRTFDQACAVRRVAARLRGASMVEFLIVTPFALLLVLGIVQLGLMFVAKQIVNEAAFVAARAGAVDHARTWTMKQALVKAMVPFYQNTTTTNDLARLSTAWALAEADLLQPWNLSIQVLNPSAAAFTDFGLTDAQGQTYIPNDSLEYRTYAYVGRRSRESIQDANVLKIRVAYAYELKVPLMQTVFKAVMCGADSGIDAFGRGSWLSLFGGFASATECLQYYERGRVPIVTYATVQMQSPAWPS
jgi:Flp pilus assembly protein TadG